ncbi:3753_t:CDS:1, partial [Gigaspora rosea]
ITLLSNMNNFPVNDDYDSSRSNDEHDNETFINTSNDFNTQYNNRVYVIEETELELDSEYNKDTRFTRLTLAKN